MLYKFGDLRDCIYCLGRKMRWIQDEEEEEDAFGRAGCKFQCAGGVYDDDDGVRFRSV